LGRTSSCRREERGSEGGHCRTRRTRYVRPRSQRGRRFATLRSSAISTPAAVKASARMAMEDSSRQKRNRIVTAWAFCRAKITTNRRTTVRTIRYSIDCHLLHRVPHSHVIQTPPPSTSAVQLAASAVLLHAGGEGREQLGEWGD